MAGFQQVQADFIAHIRDPQQHPFKGVEERRLKIYQDLFFNNVVGFLSSAFPVLESLYEEQEWLRLARDFFVQHNCRSPFFVEISKEFVEFLSNEYEPTEQDPPFLLELAHYEWVELDVSVRKSTAPIMFSDGACLPDHIYLSPLADILSYQYPVHAISPEFQPQEVEEQTYLVVYRDKDDEVNFTKVNAVTAHLLTLLQQESQVTKLVEAMQEALAHLDPQQVASSCHQILLDFIQQQILCLGEGD